MASPQLNIGINNCFAVKRWSSPEEWTSVVSEILGLDMVQFSLDLMPPAVDLESSLVASRNVRRCADSKSIEIREVFTGLAAYSANLLLSDSPTQRNQAEEWYSAMIRVAAEMGAKGFGGHVAAYSVNAYRTANLEDELVERMCRLSDVAAGVGLQYLLFENLPVSREPAYTIEHALHLEQRLLNSAIPWKLCLDVGHAATMQTNGPSDDPIEWLLANWVRTPVLQLQQSERGADNHAPFTTETNRNGVVDRDQVLETVRRWHAPSVEMYLEIIPAHEASDSAVLEDLVQSVEFWLDGLSSQTGS